MHQEEELDILALLKYFWEFKIRILLIVAVFLVLGVVYAFLTPEHYTATSTFVPQTSDQSKQGNSLGNLASLAGVALPQMASQSEIPSALYPQILSSTIFKKALLNSILYLEEWEKPLTYAQYYEQVKSDDVLTLIKKYTIGLPRLIFSRNSRPERKNQSPDTLGIAEITKEEYDHFMRLQSQMKISPNNKEGFVSLSFTMPNAKLSAQMTKHAQELLQNELIAYKVSNAREQLLFSERNYAEKRKELKEAQNRLANFRDSNQNVVSASAQSQIRALEAEYNFAFNIFTEIAKQLEQAKLQVSKDTPVFTIIQPVTVPYERSAPNKLMIILMFTLIGFLISVIYVFYIGAVRYVHLNWKKINPNQY
jgi:uncharacterized protein involved in exopolysaccharide biosynthesis